MCFIWHSFKISLGGIPKMKLNTGTFASSNTRAWSSNRVGEYGLKVARGAPKVERWAASGARLLLKAGSSDVLAASSSIQTHNFIANGFDVCGGISPITY